MLAIKFKKEVLPWPVPPRIKIL